MSEVKKNKKLNIQRDENNMNEIKKTKLVLLKTITPMHVGASEGSGIIDMPIQRETSTNIPKVESSSFKGVLRERYRKLFKENSVDVLFGKGDSGGEIAFTDLRLLFFPVKSSKHIFSLITCPYVLERFFEDTVLYDTITVSGLLDLLKNYKSMDKDIAGVLDNGNEEQIYLEEYLFKTKKIECENLFNNIKGLEEIKDKIVIVQDESFIDFVSYYTEVVTRNKIDQETGTTKETGLFTQEYVPSEAIFYGMISKFDNILLDKCTKNRNAKIFKEFVELFSKSDGFKKLQLGGNSTLGKGIVKVIN